MTQVRLVDNNKLEPMLDSGFQTQIPRLRILDSKGMDIPKRYSRVLDTEKPDTRVLDSAVIDSGFCGFRIPIWS